MPGNTVQISVQRSALEILGIVFMRFRPAQRIWGLWLVAVNAASLLFIEHIEAQVTLGAVGVALIAQAAIYQRKRFIRLLGVTHVLWVPMLVWIGSRLGTQGEGQGALQAWLYALLITNAVSLAIDAWDALRFMRGERTPYYAW